MRFADDITGGATVSAPGEKIKAFSGAAIFLLPGMAVFCTSFLRLSRDYSTDYSNDEK